MECAAALPVPSAGALLFERIRAFARRRRVLITIAGSLMLAAALALVLVGRRDQFATALSKVAVPVLAVTVLLQVVALVARSESWHQSIEAAGGRVQRRI